MIFMEGTLMSKIALITGVTGQDGAYLAEFLLDKGWLLQHGFGSFRHHLQHKLLDLRLRLLEAWLVPVALDHVCEQRQPVVLRHVGLPPTSIPVSLWSHIPSAFRDAALCGVVHNPGTLVHAAAARRLRRRPRLRRS